MEKEYIAYPLYNDYFKVIEPYSHLKRGKIIRKIRDLIGRITKKPFFCFNKALLDQKIATYLIYDTVNPNIVKFIRQSNKNARIIIYYINPVAMSNDYLFYKKFGCDMWSFDQNDCVKYGMSWNPLHYFGREQRKQKEILYDVYFVGVDKGRYSYLTQLKEEFKNKGIKCLFLITNDTNSPFYDHKKYSKRIKYNANLDLIHQTKALLDIMQKGQSGFTLRIPESMINHKKLITNNKRIKEYSFYCKENIFILGEDDFERIDEFINGSWNHSKDEEIEALSIDKWILKLNASLEE